MKKIEAIIRPAKVGDVYAALPAGSGESFEARGE